MAAIDCTTALANLGCMASFTQLIPSLDGLSLYSFRGKIMAVQVPAPGTGVECALLVHQDGYPLDVMEFFDLQTLVDFLPD